MNRGSKSATANRRRYPRVVVSYQLSAWGGQQSFNAMLCDLSARGALIETDTQRVALSPRTTLTLTLRCEYGSGSTNARVVRQNGQRIAVTFEQPNDDFLALLVELIPTQLRWVTAYLPTHSIHLDPYFWRRFNA